MIREEAIKDLKIEPCNDAISRQAAIEFLKRPFSASFMMEYLENAPSVQPKQKWIPVSERLPEDGQSVLFCDIDNDIMVGYHVKKRPNTHFTENVSLEDVKNVKAWIPLPEPWNEND